MSLSRYGGFWMNWNLNLSLFQDVLSFLKLSHVYPYDHFWMNLYLNLSLISNVLSILNQILFHLFYQNQLLSFLFFQFFPLYLQQSALIQLYRRFWQHELLHEFLLYRLTICGIDEHYSSNQSNFQFRESVHDCLAIYGFDDICLHYLLPRQSHEGCLIYLSSCALILHHQGYRQPCYLGYGNDLILTQQAGFVWPHHFYRDCLYQVFDRKDDLQGGYEQFVGFDHFYHHLFASTEVEDHLMDQMKKFLRVELTERMGQKQAFELRIHHVEDYCSQGHQLMVQMFEVFGSH